MMTGQKPLLEPGRYRAEQDGDVFHAYGPCKTDYQRYQTDD